MIGRDGLRLLLVDDDPDMARLVRQLLVGHGFPAPIHVTTAAEAVAAAERADVVILDHQLPDGNGLDAIEAVRGAPGRPAVIVITAHGNESLAATALRRGADDYLVKDASLAELLPQVLERVRRARALREALEHAERDLVRAERLAAIGELTVTLHHEINNPLMSAMAEVELLLAGQEPLSEAQRGALGEVKQALMRIRDIVRRTRELRQGSTVEYLGGVRMLDLAETEPAPVVRRGRAALLLADESLARVTSLLLRHAGFDVERCRNTAELDRWSRTLGTALLLVGAGGGDPLAGFRPTGERDYHVVALTDDPAAGLAAGADAAIALPFDPTTFTVDVLRVMGAVVG